jgi:NAD(P)-dependent dehydrogenase (short-subunit alcohol dehydrogenase family)
MATFHATSTGEEVVKALADQVKGRIFVITGANAVGLGGKLAVTLAAGSPAQIIIVSRTAKNAEPVLASIAAANPAVKTKFVSCDLTDRDSIRQAVATITEIAPKIDVLINNAGISTFSSVGPGP